MGHDSMEDEIENFRNQYEKRLNELGFHYSKTNTSSIEYERHRHRSAIPNDALIIYFNDEGIAKIVLFEYTYHYRLITQSYFFNSMEELFKVLEVENKK